MAGRGERPSNKGMKLTKLSAAPGWLHEHQTRGAASCPRRRETAGTASQLIPSVRPTQMDGERGKGATVGVAHGESNASTGDTGPAGCVAPVAPQGVCVPK